MRKKRLGIDLDNCCHKQEGQNMADPINFDAKGKEKPKQQTRNRVERLVHAT